MKKNEKKFEKSSTQAERLPSRIHSSTLLRERVVAFGRLEATLGFYSITYSTWTAALKILGFYKGSSCRDVLRRRIRRLYETWQRPAAECFSLAAARKADSRPSRQAAGGGDTFKGGQLQQTGGRLLLTS